MQSAALRARRVSLWGGEKAGSNILNGSSYMKDALAEFMMQRKYLSCVPHLLDGSFGLFVTSTVEDGWGVREEEERSWRCVRERAPRSSQRVIMHKRRSLKGTAARTARLGMFLFELHGLLLLLLLPGSLLGPFAQVSPQPVVLLIQVRR